jgi:hypothetical protein
MLTLNDAKKILKTFHISDDIQNKILLLFLSYGTPSANMIKTECLKLSGITHYDDNIKTLWRLKLYNSNYSLYNIINYSIIKKCYSTLNTSHYDLSAAAFYPYPESNTLNNILINSVIKTYLYRMFYNLDKFHYGEYGTPSANIIRNAITNNIIKYSN